MTDQPDRELLAASTTWRRSAKVARYWPERPIPCSGRPWPTSSSHVRELRRASNLHAVPAGPPEVPRTMEGVPMCSGRVAQRCFSHFG